MTNLIELTNEKSLSQATINAGQGLLSRLDDAQAAHRRFVQALDRIGGGVNDVLSARDANNRDGQITIVGHGLIEGQLFTIVWGDGDANQFAFAVAGTPNGNNVPFVQLASARFGLELPALNTANLKIWRTNTLAGLVRNSPANTLADFNAAYTAEQELASLIGVSRDAIEQFAARVVPQS